MLVANLQTQLDEHRQRVDVDQFDLPIRELIRMIEESELSIAPEYQRQFRWDEERESELVESIFLGLPVPPLFVATNSDATWELVDGLQRVSTLVHFTQTERDSLRRVSKKAPLVLSGLKKLTSFNGLSFAELPTPLQVTFKRRSLRVTALSDKSQLDVRFDLFERLNRGGVVLTPQEVRSCIFRGRLNDLLQELAKNPAFVSMTKLQRGHLSDGTREEQVLKFLAYLENRAEFKGDVTEFLNDFMDQNRTSPRIQEWSDLFVASVDALYEIFQGPVLRPKYGNTPLNQFEALMVACAELVRDHEGIGGDAQKIMSDDDLVRFSTKGTNTQTALHGRISRARELLRV